MSLKGTAKETLAILERGELERADGARVSFARELLASVNGTEHLTPAALDRWLAGPPSRGTGVMDVQVTPESTQVAAHRLVHGEGVADLVLLNFASAKNAGGGFLNGAKAQEEDLARCSALYPCLRAAPGYYTANRNPAVSMLYTDHMIYSPRVPFFRVRSRELLDHVFLASVITAPAPNAGQHRRREGTEVEIEAALRRRAGLVLALAEARGHRSLLLGAWGCGVFKNRATLVADAFGTWLESERFARSFARVCFAVLDKQGDTRAAFEQRFARRAG